MPRILRTLMSAIVLVPLLIASLLPGMACAQSPDALLNDADRAWIAAHPVIRLASDPVWAPVDFLDAQDHHQGMTADYVALLNAKLGLNMRWEQTRMPWEEVLAAARERRIDVIPTAGKRPDREEYLSFTEPPYVSFRSVIVVRDDAPFISGMGDLSSGRIALVPGYAESADFAERYPHHQIVPAASVEDALTAVATGRATATVGNLAVVNWVIRTKALTNLRIAALYSEEERSVHLAVRKDWPELVTILNKGLAAITPEEHARIRNRWYEVEGQKGLDPRQVWTVALGVLLLIAVIATVTALWLRRLRHEINERKRAEAEAEASGKRLREITDSLPGMVYQVMVAPNLSSKVTMVSDGVTALFGKTPKEVIGTQDVLSNLVHPDDRHIVHKNFIEIVRNGKPGNFDYRSLGPDGSYRWIRSFASGAMTPDGYLAWNGFSLDITNEVEARQKLDAAEQLLRDVTDSVPGAIFQRHLAPTGEVSYPFLSAGYHRLGNLQNAKAGYSGQAEEFEAFPPEERTAIEQARRQSIETMEPYTIENRMFLHGGGYIWVRTSAVPRKEADGSIVWNGYSFDITQRKETEARLEAAEKLVREVTDNAPGFFFQLYFDDAGNRRYNFISRGVENITGYTPEELMADPNRLLDATDVEDRASVLNAWARSRDALAAYQVEYRIRTKSDDLRWLRGSATPSPAADGSMIWNGFTIDVTDEKAAAELLATTQRQLTQITTNMPGAAFHVQISAEGEMTMPFISKGIEALSGLSVDKIGGRLESLMALVLPEDQGPMTSAIVGAVQAVSSFVFDPRLIHATTGELRWLRVSSAPVITESGPTWFGTMQDITDFKQLEAQLAEAKQLAEAANRAKSEFLANMSHEIRTPMNAIVGLSNLGLKSTAPARLQDYLRKIHGASQSLLEIINGILDYSKIEAGMLSLEQASFDLYEVLENLSGLLNLRASEKGLELLISVDPEVPYHLIGDSLRLGQILLNLTGNALKFTEHGQIVIRVAINGQTEGRVQLRFEVADTGIGMNSEQVSRLFTAFSQADSSTTRRYGGSGLGLSISKRLVELMGGEIGTRSEAGTGSVFHFTADFGLAEVAGPRLEAPPDLRNLRVLAVDDNFTALDILRTYLESFGLRVDRASSGVQAITAVQRESARDPYQLVLMDWQMPGMNGIDAAQQIRESRTETMPKIVMVSAYGREEIMRQADESGLDGFLIKPVNPSVLFDTILHAFGKEAALGPSLHGRSEAALSELPDGLRVLVVEDNEINQEVARDLLESFGADVTLAANGQLGVAAAAAEDFDVILMDIQMPVMDGFEATRAIRALDSPRATVPIIAMTANAMVEDRLRCLSAGMNDHLGKPVDDQRLLQTLIRWVKPGANVESGDGKSVAGGTGRRGAHIDVANPNFDLGAAQRRLGDNRATLIKMVRRFLDMSDAIEPLREQMTQADLAAAIISAHSIKGVAGTLGAVALERAALKMEKALKAGEAATSEFTEVADLHAEARQIFTEVLLGER